MNELSYLVFDPDLVSAYDELPLWSAMFGLLLLENVPLAEVRVALDVGCGTGFPLGARVHGVDPWRAALARAGEKIAHRSISNVTLHDASGAAMPFGDESFDLIVSNLGVNNFDDAAAVVRECRRVSRDGATLVLTTNLQGHMHEFYAVFEDVLNATGGGEAVQRLQERLDSHARERGDLSLTIPMAYIEATALRRRSTTPM